MNDLLLTEKKIYAPGLYPDISIADYHASEGISRSGISEMQKSPLHYWHRYLSPTREKQEPTEAMLLGSAVHTLSLEPEKFEQEFIVMPKIDGRTKEGKATKILFEDAAIGKQIITEKTLEKAKVMSNTVLNHRRVQQILNGANIENSFFWVDEFTGILCKARPDIWNPAISVLADLKTAKESIPSSFNWTVRDGNYHIQAAMQIDAVYAVTKEKIKNFIFIVVQNEAPYKPYIYILDEMIIEAGRREYKEALKVFEKCFKENDWDRDRETILPVVFKDWQLNESTFYKLLDVYQCGF